MVTFTVDIVAVVVYLRMLKIINIITKAVGTLQKKKKEIEIGSNLNMFGPEQKDEQRSKEMENIIPRKESNNLKWKMCIMN